MAENHHIGHDPPLPCPPGRGAPAAPAEFSRWLASLLLVALTVLFYWRLVLPPSVTWLAGDDNAYQVLPWLQAQAREWHAGRVSFWDPFEWLGQPLLAQVQPGSASPLHWPLLLLPFGQVPLALSWLNWYFVLLHLLGAAGAYRLARSLGCRRETALFGGLVFSLSGWFAQTFRPQMAASAVWAPLVLRFLLRSLDRVKPARSATLAGFFLGLCWLGGHHQIPIFLTLACLLIWAPSWRERILALPFAAFLLATAATAALQVLPALEYGRLAVRWVGTDSPLTWSEKVPARIHALYSLPPASLFSIVSGGFHGQWEPFLGGVAFLLALVCLVSGGRRPAIRRLTFLALFGVLVSLGPVGVLHRALYALVPLFDKARSPSSAIFLFGLGASALAAAGLEAVLRRRPRWPVVLALAWAAAAPAALLRGDFRHALTSPPLYPLPAAASISLCLALVLWLWSRKCLSSRSVAVLFTLLALVEIYPVSTFAFASLRDDSRMAALNSLQRHADIARFLLSQPGHYRVDIDDSALPYNFGDWYGLPQTQGYLASVTENVYRYELHTPWAKRLFGVRFLVAPAPTAFHSREVFAGAGGLRVYASDNVLARVFTVHEAYQMADPRQSAGELYRIRAESASRTFTAGPPPELERCPGSDSAAIALYEPDNVRIRAKMACRGMLILTDTHYPGWRAYLDGQPAPIHAAYGAARGVVVPTGDHLIEFRFSPVSIYLGAALTLLAALAALFSALPVRLHW